MNILTNSVSRPITCSLLFKNETKPIYCKMLSSTTARKVAEKRRNRTSWDRMLQTEYTIFSLQNEFFVNHVQTTAVQNYNYFTVLDLVLCHTTDFTMHLEIDLHNIFMVLSLWIFETILANHN